MNQRLKSFYKQIGYVLLILFFARCYLSKDSLFSNFSAYDLFGCIGDSVTVTGVLMFIYEKFLWRFNPLEKIPRLEKHYVGTILSSYDDVSRIAYLDAQQTLLTIHIVVRTEESRSQSVNAAIIDLNGEKCLVYTYINTPNALVRSRSSMHYGTAALYMDGKKLSGDYYTDRKSTGIMKFCVSTKT